MQKDYIVIEKALTYIHENFTKQPSLQDIAAHVGLEITQFQKLFTQWAGVSPKKFLQFVTYKQCKDLLEQNKSLLQTTYESGLSGTSRLHDLFVTIVAMTPGEYKLGGANLIIEYEFYDSKYGMVLIANTTRGICYLGFCNKHGDVSDLITRYPNAIYKLHATIVQKKALHMLSGAVDEKITLHVCGTPFQLQVWEALLKIPAGDISTYGIVANYVHNTKAVRAVGSAIGANPVSYLIPCHRVITSTGIVGNYHWGAWRKIAMLGLEGKGV
jgi:AraC family transcriptional regulator, regulatory protein of adaptative response / methylated-DNA-[protein]-cysteine methyltransferase